MYFKFYISFVIIELSPYVQIKDYVGMQLYSIKGGICDNRDLRVLIYLLI